MAELKENLLLNTLEFKYFLNTLEFEEFVCGYWGLKG